MTLVDAHRAELRASGLTDETIARAGVFSAPERQVRDVLGYGAGPGLVFPYQSLNGNDPYARVKLDRPGQDGTRYRSPAGRPNRLYIPPIIDSKVLADGSAALWITEGEKKALKACQEGIACLAVSGVWSWRTKTGDAGKTAAIPDLNHVAWRGRTVYLVFDSDLATNPNVKLAEFELGRELGRRGARVSAIRLPAGPNGAKVGLDDYLLTHSVEAFCALEPIVIPDPQKRQGPEVVEARALLGRTYPEQPAIVGDGIIVRGSLNVIGGPPKVGKSVKVMNLALKRSIERPWLGHRTTSGRTLVVQAEIPERELQKRLSITLEELEAPLPEKRLYFVTHRGIRLDRGDGLQAVRKLIEQTRPDLFVLDPLARFFSGDENSSREVGRLIGALDDLIQTYGLSVLLVHHTAKPSAQDPREGGQRLRGSSALFGAADTVMLLDRNDEGFRLSFQLRHGKEPEPMMLHRSERLWFAPAGPSEELLAVNAIVRTVGMTYGQLIAAIRADQEVSRATAERLVKRAQMGGVIGKNGDGLYASTLTSPHHHAEGEVRARA